MKERRNLGNMRWIWAVPIAATALIIGCGGGGGGGGSSNNGATNSTATTSTATTSTATTSTATTSTATTSTATTSTATTTATAGGTAGSLPPNAILFNQQTSLTSASTYIVEQISPTVQTPTPTPYISNVPIAITAFAQNPNVKSQFVFAAYSKGLGSLQGVYTNSTLSLTGATNIVAPAFGTILSLSLTQDGNHVVLTGTDSNNQFSYLYSVSTTGKNLVQLDTSQGSAVSPTDSDTIVYSNAPTGSAFQLYTRSLSKGVSGPVKQLTTDTIGDKFGPTFSRDGSSVAYQLANYTTSLSSISVINVSTGVVTNLPNPTNYSPYAEAFSADGTSIAVLATDGTTNQPEISTQPVSASGTPKVLYGNQLILAGSGLYWTTGGGRSVAESQSLQMSVRNSIRQLNRSKASRPVLHGSVR